MAMQRGLLLSLDEESIAREIRDDRAPDSRQACMGYAVSGRIFAPGGSGGLSCEVSSALRNVEQYHIHPQTENSTGQRKLNSLQSQKLALRDTAANAVTHSVYSQRSLSSFPFQRGLAGSRSGPCQLLSPRQQLRLWCAVPTKEASTAVAKPSLLKAYSKCAECSNVLGWFLYTWRSVLMRCEPTKLRRMTVAQSCSAPSLFPQPAQLPVPGV